MKTVVFDDYGAADVLYIKNLKKPTPKPDEVLIKVAAAGLNRADIAQRKGHYPAPKGTPENILGLEVSGTVKAKGNQVHDWKEGDEVCALLPGGGYSEYVTIDAGSCLPVPKNYSLVDAASIPEALFTVWHNVFQRGQLKKGQDVLIYGGSGGIGSMAIQLLSLYNANPITLASTPEKVEFCKSLGAHKVLNYKTENLIDNLGANSLDLILDSFGGEYLNINIELLRPEGRMVYINAMQGSKTHINLFKMLQKRLWITGSTLRSRPFDFKKGLANEIRVKAFPLIENPKFKNMTNYKFPVEEVVEAHRLMDSRDFTGKIVLVF